MIPFLQAVSVAIALYPVKIPEIQNITSFEEVRPVLDEYWADNGVMAVGLSVRAGDRCIIYAIDLGDRRSDEIYTHEYLHCLGLNHDQIAEVARRTNIDL